LDAIGFFFVNNDGTGHGSHGIDEMQGGGNACVHKGVRDTNGDHHQVIAKKTGLEKGHGLLSFNGQGFVLVFEYAKENYCRECHPEKTECIWIESTGIGDFGKKRQEAKTAGGKDGENDASCYGIR